jgi:hypothetical protein
LRSGQFKAIITDSHFWVPAVVLILGALLLVTFIERIPTCPQEPELHLKPELVRCTWLGCFPLSLPALGLGGRKLRRS